MRKGTTFAVAIAAAAALVLTGCTGSGSGSESTSSSAHVDGGRVSGPLNTVNTEKVKSDSGEITMAIEKTITNWNTLTAAGDISEGVWVTTPIYPSVFTIQPDGSTISLNKDMMDSAEVVSQNPTVVQYKIKKDAVWSDGSPISADDFIYQWKVMNGRDCPDCQTSNTNGLDKVASVVGSDSGKTVTVTYSSNYSEWQRPFSRLLPAHIAAEHGDLAASFNDYFANTTPTFSGGPYIISDFEKGVSVTLTKNPKWYGSGPNLKKVTFRMITDAQQTPIALQNKEIQAMYPQPQVDLLTQLDQMAQQGINYQMNNSLVMETFVLNLSNSLLKDVAVRKALFTALDQQQIIDKTVGQFDSDVKPLGSVMIMQQQKGYQNKTKAFGYGEGNVSAAKKILTDAGYKIQGGTLHLPDGSAAPALRAVYSVGNAIRQSEMEIMAVEAKKLGITLNLESTDSLGNTFSEKAPYGYDIMLSGFTGSPFLGANAAQRFKTGTGYNLHYSSSKVDSLIDEALQASSQSEVIKDINAADKIVVGDVFMMPLYQKPSLLAYDSQFGNMRDNPTISGPTYNIAQWGVIAK